MPHCVHKQMLDGCCASKSVSRVLAEKTTSETGHSDVQQDVGPPRATTIWAHSTTLLPFPSAHAPIVWASANLNLLLSLDRRRGRILAVLKMSFSTLGVPNLPYASSWRNTSAGLRFSGYVKHSDHMLKQLTSRKLTWYCIVCRHYA